VPAVVPFGFAANCPSFRFSNTIERADAIEPDPYHRRVRADRRSTNTDKAIVSNTSVNAGFAKMLVTTTGSTTFDALPLTSLSRRAAAALLARAFVVIAATVTFGGLTGCGGGGGSSSPAVPPPSSTSQNFSDPVVYSTDAKASLGSAQELVSVTHGQIAVGGNPITYTATTGHLTAPRLGTGPPQASFFYVAYTADNKVAATRPLTFFYNGGPGSATVWLHLGSFGPKRLVTGDPATTAPTPFPLVDNAESLLDVTDLVFVDAIGTGYSEAIAPNTNQTFWGVDADAAVFRDFVMRYLAVNNRSASPKFLFGESYGTTRSAVLANMLESAGVQLNGVVLQSSILNYSSNCGVVTGTISCAGYLPSYGASGAWYNLTNPVPTNLPAFIAQMRTLAVNQYAPAVSSLLAANVAFGTDLLMQLANTTGVPLAKWQMHMNMGPDYFQSNLVPGMLIGRYDARVSAPFNSPLASQGDPSSTFITSSFVSGIANYMSTTLNYTNPSTYVTLSNAISGWNYSHDGVALPDVIPDLAAAMVQNPAMKVLSLNGYHDLATPFFQTEEDLARLGTNANVQTKFYIGGHMTYLDDASRVQEKADLVQFYQSAVGMP
jgi:carboxypeptidase C (cathepsin A)